MTLLPWALVAAGGAVGACARFGVGAFIVAQGWPSMVATGCVNVVGCFLIGLLYARTQDPNVRLALGVGVLGGFTTFSSFGRETLELLAAGRMGFAAASVAFNVIIGLVGVWFGQRVAG